MHLGFQRRRLRTSSRSRCQFRLLIFLQHRDGAISCFSGLEKECVNLSSMHVASHISSRVRPHGKRDIVRAFDIAGDTRQVSSTAGTFTLAWIWLVTFYCYKLPILRRFGNSATCNIQIPYKQALDKIMVFWKYYKINTNWLESEMYLVLYVFLRSKESTLDVSTYNMTLQRVNHTDRILILR